MSKQWIGAFLLLACAATGPMANRARAQWDVSGNADVNAPLPFGPSRADGGGIYFNAEFLFVHGPRSLGHQVVAQRGFRDTDGTITGFPGQFVGSGRTALTTDGLGKTSFTPGFRVGVGYTLDDGSAFSITYAHLASVKYSAGAGPVPPGFNPGSQLADSFLFQPVYNFGPQFSGPPNKVGDIDPQTRQIVVPGSGFSPYGIWNGATTVDSTFLQRFDNWDATYRMPVFESEYAKTYILSGARFAWIWERFSMRTVSVDNAGNAGPIDTAQYTNIMSQRMYGPFIGTSNDIYLGNAFALSADITGSALLSIVKERAKYALGDHSTQSKRGTSQYTLVPNVNAGVHLSWYPLEGVQVRLGYELWSFFNTLYMQQPIGWNAGAIDPSYKNLPIRIFHGFNVGLSYSF